MPDLDELLSTLSSSRERSTRYSVMLLVCICSSRPILAYSSARRLLLLLELLLILLGRMLLRELLNARDCKVRNEKHHDPGAKLRDETGSRSHGCTRVLGSCRDLCRVKLFAALE